MIYTITLNPSIDYIMFTETFDLGGLNRAHTTHKFAGGKGINVSRVLKALNQPSTALGFTGGFPGAFIKEVLHASDIHTDFIEVEEDTRINVKLKGHTETEINALGPAIHPDQVEALLQQIKQLNASDYVIIAGSVPQALPADIYSTIAAICKERNIPFVVDAEKTLLTQTLQYQPEFVKPNKVELEEMFNITIESDEDTILAARRLMNQGAKNVLVSLGGEGAIFVTNDASYKAVVPNGKVVNTVGSGDSTVAGMVAGLAAQLTLEESFKQAVSCGTATAFTEDLATSEQIAEIISKVTITKI
ncbi:1-phosphofructokinase [Macrococcoides caseolyticum]|uniref:1-phosphofructokinase n=1 Tax=Macrococcoides caseolyticum TaxID=69966 RepID=UPI001F18F25C|nr:1-phosphofructokinase [Macrococcus caseolyticus]MCE4955899.1 1-phosphofructokinase [Macrococcus caseolyticus]